METIVVRAAEANDIAAYHRIHNDPEVFFQTMQPPFLTVGEAGSRLNSNESSRTLAAEFGGEVVGFGDLVVFYRRRAHAARISVAVDPAFARKGVGSTLLQALLKLGEGWYAVRRFELKLFTDNEGAIALYRKFGFEVEATHQQFALRDGQYADAMTMAKLIE